MKWVIDTSGRFGWRPYYNPEELDNECEQIVSAFLLSKYGSIRFPVSTDDLTILVERDTSDLDLYADLSGGSDDIEGATDFFPDRKPEVKIAKELSLESSKYFRLRTTLAHEYGHVRFHNFLWDSVPLQKPASDIVRKLSSQRQAIARLRQKLNPGQARERVDSRQGGVLGLVSLRKTFNCTQGFIIQAPVSDWMEWQASYAGGAILMPLSVIHSKVRESVPARDRNKPIPIDSSHARELMNRIADVFNVSVEAAQVRLQKLGIIHQADKS